MAASKRQRDDHDARPSSNKKSRSDNAPRKGFSVGPANLPDGAYKRKVKKIKKDLIYKAKVRKRYAKIRENELRQAQKAANQTENHDANQNEHHGNNDEKAEENDKSPAPEPTLDLHPERQALLDEPEPEPETKPARKERGPREKREKRKKPKTFGKEAAIGQKHKEEAEARRKAHEEAERERQEKIAQRERMRKQMAKARATGKDGKRRLGREAPVLLERVKKLVGDA